MNWEPYKEDFRRVWDVADGPIGIGEKPGDKPLAAAVGELFRLLADAYKLPETFEEWWEMFVMVQQETVSDA